MDVIFSSYTLRPMIGAKASVSSLAWPAILNQFILLAFVIFTFYLLMIRPQQKKYREHQQLLRNLKVGDKIVTSSGIHGFISKIRERTVILKISDQAKVELEKSSIVTVERSVTLSSV